MNKSLKFLMEKSGGWLSETFQSTVWDVKSVQTMSDYIKTWYKQHHMEVPKGEEEDEKLVLMDYSVTVFSPNFFGGAPGNYTEIKTPALVCYNPKGNFNAMVSVLVEKKEKNADAKWRAINKIIEMRSFRKIFEKYEGPKDNAKITVDVGDIVKGTNKGEQVVFAIPVEIKVEAR